MIRDRDGKIPALFDAVLSGFCPLSDRGPEPPCLRHPPGSCPASPATGWGTEDIEQLIVHQANARIGAAVADALGIPPERVPSNIAHVANTSAASIPLLLTHAATQGQLTAGNRVLMVCFGAGFTWAATTLTWPKNLKPFAGNGTAH